MAKNKARLWAGAACQLRHHRYSQSCGDHRERGFELVAFQARIETFETAHLQSPVRKAVSILQMNQVFWLELLRFRGL